MKPNIFNYIIHSIIEKRNIRYMRISVLSDCLKNTKIAYLKKEHEQQTTFYNTRRTRFPSRPSYDAQTLVKITDRLVR